MHFFYKPLRGFKKTFQTYDLHLILKLNHIGKFLSGKKVLPRKDPGISMFDFLYVGMRTYLKPWTECEQVWNISKKNPVIVVSTIIITKSTSCMTKMVCE